MASIHEVFPDFGQQQDMRSLGMYENFEDSPQNSGERTPIRPVKSVENFQAELAKPKYREKKRKSEQMKPESDLMVQYNEFNVPLRPHSGRDQSEPMPSGIEPFDDYFQLIDDQFASAEPTDWFRQDKTYAEETQLGHNDCDIVRMHIKRCRGCRNRLRRLLKQYEEEDEFEEQPKIENFEPVLQPTPGLYTQYLDIFFFVAAGIFLIYILDMFLRLGRKLGRNRSRRRSSRGGFFG